MSVLEIIGERAKRARHSQVCSIENCDIYIIVRTYVCMSHLPFDVQRRLFLTPLQEGTHHKLLTQEKI